MVDESFHSHTNHQLPRIDFKLLGSSIEWDHDLRDGDFMPNSVSFHEDQPQVGRHNRAPRPPAGVLCVDTIEI